MTMEPPFERRKHKRFLAKEGAFVELRDYRGKIGEIIEVSKGGLAFQYIDVGDRPKESLRLDIFLKHAGLRLEKLPAETVSDAEITKLIQQGITTMTRHGVTF
jgi:hypothetical protein